MADRPSTRSFAWAAHEAQQTDQILTTLGLQQTSSTASRHESVIPQVREQRTGQTGIDVLLHESVCCFKFNISRHSPNAVVDLSTHIVGWRLAQESREKATSTCENKLCTCHLAAMTSSVEAVRASLTEATDHTRAPTPVQVPTSSKTRQLVCGPDSPEPPYPVYMQGEVMRGFGRGSKDLGCPTGFVLLFPSREARIAD